jgi:hypothetical protein
MSLWPDHNERSYLAFAIGEGRFGLRYLVAAGLFVLGFWFSLAGACLPLGLLLILLGHLPLWVRRQKLAPAPVDPLEDPVWAPADPSWHEHVRALIGKGRRWDQSFWDISSPLVIVTMLVLGLVGLVAFAMGVALFDGLALLPFAAAVLTLWLPLFVNGMRAPWHPDQLSIKAEALEVVPEVLEAKHPDRYDLVPLLGLRQGERGRYPVDARIMLRPKEDDGTGFIGVQVQVCINSVQGKNYPYAYCVVLGKPGFALEGLEAQRVSRDGLVLEPVSRDRLVLEPGGGDDVSYLVVRQYADRRGGWHTGPPAVSALVAAALDIAERARRANS